MKTRLSELGSLTQTNPILFLLGVILLSIAGGYSIAAESGVLLIGLLLIGAAVLAIEITKKRTWFPVLIVFMLGAEQFRLEFLGAAGTLTKFGTLILIGLYLQIEKDTVRQKTATIPLPQQYVWQGLFVLYTLITVTWSIDQTTALWGMSTLISLLILTYFIYHFVQSEQDIEQFIWGIVIYGLVLSIYAIYESLLNRVIVGSLIIFRATAFNGNPNITAGYISLAFACLLGLILGNPKQTKRYSLSAIAGLLLMFIGVAVTASRSGLIVLFISFLIFTFRAVQTKNLRKIVWSANLIFISSYFLFPQLFFALESRFDTSQNFADPTGARLEIGQLAWRVFRESPLFGNGYYSFPVHRFTIAEFGHKKAAHSTYNLLFADLGIIGTAIFAFIILFAIQRLWRIYQHSSSNSLNLSSTTNALTISLVAALTFGLSSDYHDHKFFWLILALIPLHYAFAVNQSNLSKDSEDRKDRLIKTRNYDHKISAIRSKL